MIAQQIMNDKTKYSNRDYKSLGDRIRYDSKNISEEDYEMLQQLRLSYKQALSVIFNSIEALSHQVDTNCVCTYRIKRIESIISKLIRFPEMQVNRAEDIAGCRCILSSDAGVYNLYNRILKDIDKLPFEVKGVVHDYIAKPKESGYKSIHLNVTLRGDNKRIEIQLRSLEQHNWATLVETTDLLYDLKLKENGSSSNTELFTLHYLLSKTHNQLTIKDINYIADTVVKYNYIQTLGGVFVQNNLNVRRHWNTIKVQSKHFFLIATGKDGIPDIQGFATFDEAEEHYYNKFINNKSNKNIVLTHIRSTNFAKITAAYSNYFLTYNNTIVRLLVYLSKAVETSYDKGKLQYFVKYYQAFLDIMLFWMENQIDEIKTFNKEFDAKKQKKKYYDWGATIEYGINVFNKLFEQTHTKLQFKISTLLLYLISRYKYSQFKNKADKLTSQFSKH